VAAGLAVASTGTQESQRFTRQNPTGKLFDEFLPRPHFGFIGHLILLPRDGSLTLGVERRMEFRGWPE